MAAACCADRATAYCFTWRMRLNQPIVKLSSSVPGPSFSFCICCSASVLVTSHLQHNARIIDGLMASERPESRDRVQLASVPVWSCCRKGTTQPPRPRGCPRVWFRSPTYLIRSLAILRQTYAAEMAPSAHGTNSSADQYPSHMMKAYTALANPMIKPRW